MEITLLFGFLPAISAKNIHSPGVSSHLTHSHKIPAKKLHTEMRSHKFNEKSCTLKCAAVNSMISLYSYQSIPVPIQPVYLYLQNRL